MVSYNRKLSVNSWKQNLQNLTLTWSCILLLYYRIIILLYYNIEYLIIMCPKYLIQYFSFFNVLHLHVVLVFEKIFICHIFHWLIISVKLFVVFFAFLIQASWSFNWKSRSSREIRNCKKYFWRENKGACRRKWLFVRGGKLYF